MGGNAFVFLVLPLTCLVEGGTLHEDGRASVHPSTLPKTITNHLRSLWMEKLPEVNSTGREALRNEALDMFDWGWVNYMDHAFPKDNLLPLSCKGVDWQGGLAITLLDTLDTLLLMNQKGDMLKAIRDVKLHVNFDKDVKVHVFEMVIRALGGLLSGHFLLERLPEAFPDYDSIFLEKAVDLAQRLKPAFDSPSGLPYLFVNLKKGKLATVSKNSNTTCTACAGTLLLEFGHLSAITGDPQWRKLAEHAAKVIYDRRSSLGLVGGSINVDSSMWDSREATTGPGVDSYYEYLLKSYLMFGNLEHLHMFVDLYGSVMQQLQPGDLGFLINAHMDSGRLLRTFVSSLSAFWPGMQALCGLEREAAQLHESFLGAWREFGWLPEMFGLDLAHVCPHDPGYQLRPESIESNFILHALTKNPKYLDAAQRIQHILNSHNRVECGFASVSNVTSGNLTDIQESYFLSETMKYLYLTFTEGSDAVLDYLIFTTEGHMLPPHPPTTQEASETEERAYLQALAVESVPECRSLCKPLDLVKQSGALDKLRAAFPSLKFDNADAALIHKRRCVACTKVTEHMVARSALDKSTDARINQLSLALETGLERSQVLSQVLCTLGINPSTNLLFCKSLRSLRDFDVQHGVPPHSVVLQLSWVAQPPPLAAVLHVGPGGHPGTAPLQLHGTAARDGPSLAYITPACAQHLHDTAAAWAVKNKDEDAAAEQRGRGEAAAPVAAAEREWQGTEAAGNRMGEEGADAAATADTTTSMAQAASIKLLSTLWQAIGLQHPGTVLEPDAREHEGPSTAPVCMPLPSLMTGLLPALVAGPRMVVDLQKELLKGECAAVGERGSVTWGKPALAQTQQAVAASRANQGVIEVGEARSVFGECGAVNKQHLDQDQGGLDSQEADKLQHCQSELDHHQLLLQLTTRPASEAGGVARVQQDEAQIDRGQPSKEVSTGGEGLTGEAREGKLEATAPATAGAKASALPCMDTNIYCRDWALKGGCLTNPKWMLAGCPMSCKECVPPSLGSSGASSATSTGASQADELRADGTCHAQADWGQSDSMPAAVGAAGALTGSTQAGTGRAPSMNSDPHEVHPLSRGPCKHVPLIHGPAILASPPDACVPRLHNARELAQAVAVITRGGCSFTAKAQAAGAAGAAAYVVLSWEGAVVMGGSAEGQGVAGSGRNVHIPGMLLGATHGLLLLQEMKAAALHRLPPPDLTMAMDFEAQDTGHHATSHKPGSDADNDLQSQPGIESKQLNMYVPASSIQYVQSLAGARGLDLQGALLELVSDNKALLLLLQVAREIGPNSPSQIQKNQAMKEREIQNAPRTQKSALAEVRQVLLCMAFLSVPASTSTQTSLGAR